MFHSRRRFLHHLSVAFGAAMAACRKLQPNSTALPAGAPPAFGTAPDAGPTVSTATFEQAEKLVQFPLNPAERATAAGNWSKAMAPLYKRRTGPRKFFPPPSIAPASRWDPTLPGQPAGPPADRFIRSAADRIPLPPSDQDIVFAPVSQLSRWIETRQLTSERLTHIYLDRLR